MKPILLIFHKKLGYSGYAGYRPGIARIFKPLTDKGKINPLGLQPVTVGYNARYLKRCNLCNLKTTKQVTRSKLLKSGITQRVNCVVTRVTFVTRKKSKKPSII